MLVSPWSLRATGIVYAILWASAALELAQAPHLWWYMLLLIMWTTAVCFWIVWHTCQVSALVDVGQELPYFIYGSGLLCCFGFAFSTQVHYDLEITIVPTILCIVIIPMHILSVLISVNIANRQSATDSLIDSVV